MTRTTEKNDQIAFKYMKALKRKLLKDYNIFNFYCYI